MIVRCQYITRYIVLFAMLVFVCANIQAQRKDYKYKFISKVMNADTAVAISNCHIINKTQKMGTVSDEYGAFTITANVGDSIEFSVIGYAKLTIAASDSMYTNTRVVKLKPVAYPLSEVKIGLLSTYDRFKRDVLDKESDGLQVMAPISKWEVYIPPLPNQGGLNVPLEISPITFFYNLWSKEGKQYRHYLSVINKSADHIIIGDKFNGLLVHQLTGLENDELIEFMSFCGFTKEYLKLAPEMVINREIMAKYKEFIKKKGKE